MPVIDLHAVRVIELGAEIREQRQPSECEDAHVLEGVATNPFGHLVVDHVVDRCHRRPPVLRRALELTRNRPQVDLDAVLLEAEGELGKAFIAVEHRRSGIGLQDLDRVAADVPEHPQDRGAAIAVEARHAPDPVLVPALHLAKSLDRQDVQGSVAINLGVVTRTDKHQVIGLVPVRCRHRVDPARGCFVLLLPNDVRELAKLHGAAGQLPLEQIRAADDAASGCPRVGLDPLIDRRQASSHGHPPRGASRTDATSILSNERSTLKSTADVGAAGRKVKARDSGVSQRRGGVTAPGRPSGMTNAGPTPRAPAVSTSTAASPTTRIPRAPRCCDTRAVTGRLYAPAP